MLPRQVLPGQFWMITRRTTQRLFLLRPDEATNKLFLYVLAEAAERFDIEVILPSVLSNHHHLIVYDRHGRIIEFVEHLHKFVARLQNSLRGRCENLWSSEPVSLVRLVGADDVIDKIVYAATNPVKDGLVERVHQWPGVNGLADLLNRRTLTIRRPRRVFRAGGTMPDVITLTYGIPPELGDADATLRVIRERVAAVEERHAAARRNSGARVLGRRGVLRQSWRGQPAGMAPRGRLSPTLAARNKWARVEALRQNTAFLAAYKHARALWLRGLPTLFPAGTYWLRRFANAPVAPLPA